MHSSTALIRPRDVKKIEERMEVLILIRMILYLQLHAYFKEKLRIHDQSNNLYEWLYLFRHGWVNRENTYLLNHVLVIESII